VVSEHHGSATDFSSHKAPKLRKEPVDDMDDSQDMPDCTPLREFLEQCRETVRPRFLKSDEAAKSYQKTYRRRARWAATLGSAAVLLATIQLSGLARHVFAVAEDGPLNAVLEKSKIPDSEKLKATEIFKAARKESDFEPLKAMLPTSAEAELVRLKFLGPWPWLLPLLEAAAAISALGIVLFGMGASLKEQWLLERYKAESLRFLKFRSVIDPALWNRSVPEMQERNERLCDQVEEISATTFAALRGWTTKGTVPDVLAPPANASATKENLKPMIDYYRRKRLHFQMEYLAGAVVRNLAQDRRTRLAGPVLFFGGVAFVLAHLAVEIGGGTEDWSRFLILIAAALPVMAAGFRIHRDATEFARNASRLEAVHHTLVELSQRLRDASDTSKIFRELGFCEQVLESDLREWMRLMTEAEWFG
jgi:hypothetical protein